jgi:hypothetical protein
LEDCRLDPCVFITSIRSARQTAVRPRDIGLAYARQLFARAYAPIREEPTFETLRDQALALSAAEAVERRAEVIQKWPFDERTLIWMVGISTGAITIALSRVILLPFGI